MAHAQALGNPADWLVRAAHNRCLPDGDLLWTHTCSGQPVGQVEFFLPARPGVSARVVRQQLWARRVELPAGKDKSLGMTSIVAREYDATTGVKPIEWRLLTNRSASTAAAVAELIDWYRARWKIEILFGVLKNACRVEASQLGAIERIEPALALDLVVAMANRAFDDLMRLGRTCPDLDAALFRPGTRSKLYICCTIRRRQSDRGSTMCCDRSHASAASWRVSDREPGVKTIWLGPKDVHVAVKTMRRLRQLGHPGTCV